MQGHSLRHSLLPRERHGSGPCHQRCTQRQPLGRQPALWKGRGADNARLSSSRRSPEARQEGRQHRRASVRVRVGPDLPHAGHRVRRPVRRHQGMGDPAHAAVLQVGVLHPAHAQVRRGDRPRLHRAVPHPVSPGPGAGRPGPALDGVHADVRGRDVLHGGEEAPEHDGDRGGPVRDRLRADRRRGQAAVPEGEHPERRAGAAQRDGLPAGALRRHAIPPGRPGGPEAVRARMEPSCSG